MATIRQAVRAFLEDQGWPFQTLQDWGLQVHLAGENGRLTWTASWDRKNTFLATHTVCWFNVPQERRTAVAEFLNRLNLGLPLGNFEMDFTDGQVRYRISVPLRDGKLPRSMLDDVIFHGLATMDFCLPGLLAVAFGDTDPEEMFLRMAGISPPWLMGSPSDRDSHEQHVHPRRSGDRQRTRRRGKARHPGPHGPRPEKRGALPTSGTPPTRLNRVARFAEFLHRMKTRANEEAKDHCFILFTAEPAGDGQAGSDGADDANSSRFVQFCFHETWFAIDIPDTTISSAEATRLLRDRRGFYREAENPEAGVTDAVNLVTFDPVGKKYAYGQELEAAEDAAYVFFDLWQLPCDVPMTVSACSFNTDHRWEQDAPLEERP